MTDTLPRHDIHAIRGVFAMDEIVEAVRRAFIAYARGEIVCPQPGQLLFDRPRGDCHIKYGAEHSGATFVVKIATGFYDNPREGLPVNDGIVILFSARTGQPLAIFQDQGWLTSWRTAAAGALAVIAGAPERVRRLGIVGTGHQAELQAIWASRALGKVPVIVWGRSARKAEDLCIRLSDQGVSCSVAYDIGTLLQDCSVVVTCTPSRAPLIECSLVMPGTHLVSIGADSPGKSELDAKLFAHASGIATDDHWACVAHGDFGKALRAGHVTERADVSLGDVLAGERVLRSSERDITIVTLTGIAAQDLAIATWAHQRLARMERLLH